MKIVAVVFCAVVVVVSASLESDFAAWVAEHQKSYASPAEYAHRMTVFGANMDHIASLNARTKTARFGANVFADLSVDEFRAMYLARTPINPAATNAPVAALPSEETIRDTPTSWNWVSKGAVTPVKNQGQCGSCWAFSTTGATEGQWFLAGNPLTSLSESNLVDCSHQCIEYENQQSCNQGCNGGLQPPAYEYIMANGIDTEASYPYVPADGKCTFSTKNIGAHISNYTMIANDETVMAAELVQRGPLAIAADAAEWQFYLGGVFDLPCGHNLDHGILIVGFGEEKEIVKTHPYWLVKNSWGASWGEQGYLKIERGVNKCGLANYVSVPIV